MMATIRAVTFGEETIAFEVQFVATRRTLGIEVHPDSLVLVRAPLGCPEGLIAERVQRRAGWISQQLLEFDRYRPRTPERQYLGGESHLYLGRQYRLKVLNAELPIVRLLRGQMLVGLPGDSDPKRVKAVLQGWYRDRAQCVFREVLEQSLLRFKDIAAPRLSVRSMQSRWGSLSPAGMMTLNVQLVRAPRACIEYVVTHELCHVKHRDHDARFFRLLSQVMPDWERRKQRLEASLL